VSTNHGFTTALADNDTMGSFTSLMKDEDEEELSGDLSEKSFYRRTIDNTQQWMYSVFNFNKDDGGSNSNDTVIMVTRAVTIEPSGYTAGVIGLHVTTEWLRESVLQSVSQCRDSSIKCYLVDDGAIILYSNEDYDYRHKAGSFLGSVEPYLMQHLINESLFISRTEINFQGTCSEPEPKSSSAIRLLPSLLYELITLQWWSATYTWSYLTYANVYSWMFSDTYANVIEDQEEEESSTDAPITEPVARVKDYVIDKHRQQAEHKHCIVAHHKYHLSQSITGLAQTITQQAFSQFTLDCNNSTRKFGYTRIPDTNLVLVVVDLDTADMSSCDDEPSFQFEPEDIDDPILNEGVGNCTVDVRYRKRPPCFDTNPNINMTLESHCGACSSFLFSPRLPLVLTFITCSLRLTGLVR